MSKDFYNTEVYITLGKETGRYPDHLLATLQFVALVSHPACVFISLLVSLWKEESPSKHKI